MVKRVLVEEKGHFYICGGLKMGNDVQQLLKDAIGADYVKEMQTQKRFCVELWS
jgi:sulfite reductase alpha subunit-like flavoprotein